ncbi:hypothetical protein I3843_15G081500 [Carya illinoinensis]|nr:hypothetical protein I3843_15G081500 [Carya illinoinensis]
MLWRQSQNFSEEGLSHLEFVNASIADSEKEEQGDEIDEDKEDCKGNGIGSLDSDTCMPICLKNNQMENRDVDHHNPHHHDVDAGSWVNDGGRSEEQLDDEGDNDDDGNDWYYLDDELVLWNVSIGRQRMRKLGKRVFPKMHNSKRSPYLVVRPACVRGKHGLGVTWLSLSGFYVIHLLSFLVDGDH